ncbi:signal peptidase I [uncultured Pseudodesulfovibrio sp.]|uniref:signal peptidase I n=1 Tax=uncultured Pseudodesulfovibrio sp. TaxID=2035858 RepID=UPI0029C62B74|nr:signal peptidase I [uncultured Pseudodesulfovibrio sp.]
MPAPLTQDTCKPRKPWLALLLSLITSGTGHIYNGSLQKGLVLCAVSILLGLIIPFCIGTFTGLAVGITAGLIFWIGVSIDAWREARRQRDYALQRWNKWWVYLLVILLNVGAGTALEAIVTAHSYEAFKAPSGSMLPTLQIGDHFTAEILGETEPVHRGDIIIFFNEENGVNFVKRIIGLPGETLSIKQQIVFIDGKPLTEPYAHHTKTHFMPVRDNFAPVTLGTDEYFVMGDNREESYDSRWIGPVRRQDITARTKYIYFPGNMDSEEWLGRFGEVLR